MDRNTFRLLLLIGVVLGAAGAGIGATISIDTGYDNPAPVSDGVPLGAPDGLYVTLEGDTNAGLEQFIQGSDTVVIVSDEGNTTVQADGVADVTMHADEISGTWTNASEINAGLNPTTIDPEDKSAVTVGGDIERVAFKDASDVAADDGQADFYYGGSSGQSRVTIEGAPASTTLGAVDAESGDVLDVATSDANGQITFDELDNSNHTVLLQSGEPPTVSNASPTGDLSNPPDELAVDIDDPDFSSDTVRVEFSYEGSVVGTKTTSSPGTVTQSIENPSGGEYDWSVDVSDEYGNTVNESYSFRVPQNLTFRDEIAPHRVIDSTDVRATCYEDAENDPEILNRTTSDGRIDLAGFPTGTEFSCQVSADGYNNRTVLIDSLYQQENIFLINKSEANTVENRFIVNDRTGEFAPEDTELIVQLAVNQSLYSEGGYTWLAASGDDLGADEAFVDDLEEEKRYRILVRNEDGDQRNLGSYVPEVSGTIELNIGSITDNAVEPEGVAFNSTYVNSTDGRNIRVEYNDTTEATETLYLNIYERNNESNVLVDNESFTGPFGTFAHIEPVPHGYNESTWVVEVHADRGTDADGNVRENVQFKQYAGPGFSVLGDMPDWLVTVIFVGLMWGVAGTFSQVNGHVGGIVVAGLGAMFFFVGLVPNYLGGGVVALSLLTAGILFVRGSRAGGI